MKISAGLIITFNDKILLCHPTNASWVSSFSFPKGEVNEGESLIDAAIRECFEETSLKVRKFQIVDVENPIKVTYFKKRVAFKEVYLFKVPINDLSEIIDLELVIPIEKLQVSEIDWAGFLTKEEAKIKIFWRFQHLLNII